MSNENGENKGGQEQPDELTLLKERADLMGITYHPNIGVDKLKAKISEKTDPKKDPGEDLQAKYAAEEAATIEAGQKVPGPPTQIKARLTPNQQRMERRNRALRLVRVRVTCMNPIKGNLRGEIFSAGNAEIGMVKKFIPFNAEQGWHVPQILLTMIRNKKYMSHYETKIGGKVVKKNKLVPEFAVEVLEPLTAKELDELKQRQLMAAGH